MKFSAKTLELFQRRRYQGFTVEPDVTTMTGSFGTGRFAIIGFTCQDGSVYEARYRTFNCISVIAAADWVCEWAQGRKHDELSRLTTPQVLEALQGLPKSREFCAHLVRDALVRAAAEAKKKGFLL